MSTVTELDLEEVKRIERGESPPMAVSKLVEIACWLIDRVHALETQRQSLHDQLAMATDRDVRRIVREMEILGCEKSEASEAITNGMRIRRSSDMLFSATHDDNPDVVCYGMTPGEAVRDLDRLRTRKQLANAEARIKELESQVK